MIASALNSRFKVLILEGMLDKKLQKGPFALNIVISRSVMIFISFVNENGTTSIKTISWKQIHCSEKIRGLKITYRTSLGKQ
jgi:hypothetical protein